VAVSVTFVPTIGAMLLDAKEQATLFGGGNPGSHATPIADGELRLLPLLAVTEYNLVPVVSDVATQVFVVLEQPAQA
jgi:hypothetical protein